MYILYSICIFYYNYISPYILYTNSNTKPYTILLLSPYIGIHILRITIEEFSNRGTSQVSLPLAIHNNIQISFENDGLDRSYQLCIELLSYAITLVNTSITNTSTAAMTSVSAGGHNSDPSALSNLSVLREVIKTLNEILSWDFYSLDHDFGTAKKTTAKNHTSLITATTGNNTTNSTDDKSLRISLTLPLAWTSYLLQRGVIQTTATIYTDLNSYLNTTSYSEVVVRGCNTTIQDIQLLLINICSISGRFQTPNKTIYGEHINKYILYNYINILSTSYTTPTSGNKGHNSDLNEEYMIQNRQNILTILLHFLYNYNWSELCLLSEYKNIITNILYNTTLYISQDINNIYIQYLSKLSGKNTLALYENGSENEIMEGWRGECLNIILECWQVLLDDSWLVSTYLTSENITIHQSYTNSAGSNSMSSTSSIGSSGMSGAAGGGMGVVSLELQHRQILVVTDIKLYLQHTLYTLFTELYTVIEHAVMYDIAQLLNSHLGVGGEGEVVQQEEEEVVEWISSRQLQVWVMHICIVCMWYTK